MAALNLSVKPEVAERAKRYAAALGVSLSALVEEWMAGLDDAGPVPEVADERILEEVARAGARSLTAAGAEFDPGGEGRRLAAFLADGVLLVAAPSAYDPRVHALRSRLRAAGRAVARVLVVPQEAVERANAGEDRPEDRAAAFAALLAAAAREKASDVHVVVGARGVAVRFRGAPVVDGDRGMADLDVGRPFGAADAEGAVRHAFEAARRPRPNLRDYESAAVDDPARLPPGVARVRVQTNPLPDNGFYAILKLTGPASAPPSVDELGYAPDQAEALRLMASRPYGLTLVSGPTGSGMTTALAAALRARLDAASRPRGAIAFGVSAEVDVPGTMRFDVPEDGDPKERDRRFAEAIRKGMHAGPDIIVVGEVAGPRSSAEAFRAAMCGHAVLAGIADCGDAFRALLRMVHEEGVEPWVAFDHTILGGVVAQRLLPRLCPACRQPLLRKDHPFAFDRLERIDPQAPRTAFVASGRSCGAEGCARGVAGRVAAAEILVPDARLMDLLRRGDRAAAAEYAERELGFVPLGRAVAARIAAGEVCASAAAAF